MSYLRFINLYPNPSSHSINVVLPDNTSVSEMLILDFSGRVIKDIPVNEREIDIRSLKVGNYILRLSTEDGLISKKFLKN